MLTDEQIEKNFETLINLIETNIKRDGVDNLVKWLKSKDTKIAPASGKYHSSFKGGLVTHTLNVYYRLKRLLANEYPKFEPDENGEMRETGTVCPYSDETIAIVALLHDISKVNFYEIQERNAKDENGNWVKVPFYAVKDETQRLIFGSHSMNSLYMVSKFIKLTYEEELAILYHMGAMDTTEDKLTPKNTSEVWRKSTLALLLHQADVQSTYLDESYE